MCEEKTEELTAIEKEIVEFIENKLDGEDTKYIELYEFGKKLGRERLVIVLEQLGYTVKWYSDYLFEIERTKSKKGEEKKMLRIRLSDLNDTMVESIDHLLYQGRWSERKVHEELADAIKDMMELEPKKFREYMFYVALEEIIRTKIKDSVKIAMNKEYIVAEVIPIASQVLRDLQERNIIVNYSLGYFSGPSGDEREFTEDIEISYWLKGSETEYKFEIFY